MFSYSNFLVFIMPVELWNELVKTLKTFSSKQRSTCRILFSWSCILMLVFQPAQAFEVSLSNKKIIIGEEVELQCRFNYPCMQLRNDPLLDEGWFIGKDILPVTYGNSSSSIEKYIPNYVQTTSGCSYTLNITNFGLEDLNTYTCECHFEKETYWLSRLDQRLFVYKPPEDKINMFVECNKETCNVTFDINIVYPKPSCTIFPSVEVISKDVQYFNDTPLYRVAFTYTLKRPTAMCKTMISLNCLASDVAFSTSRWINDTDCHVLLEKEVKNRTNYIKIVLVVAVVVLGGILIGVLIWKYKREEKRQKKYIAVH